MYLIKVSHWRLLLSILLLSTVVSAQTLPETRILSASQPFERELAGGEAHTYTIQIAAGQFLNVTVDQRGIDVVVTLLGPNGNQLIEVDSPNGRQGPESITFVAKISGAHQVKVRSLEQTAQPGRYEVKLEEALRAATARENVESEAKELAQALAWARTDDERATILAQKKELVQVELVRALYVHGRDFRNLRKLPQALAISRFGLGLAEQIGDQTGIGDFAYNLGYVLHLQGDGSQGMEYLLKSFALREKLDDKRKSAEAANMIAVVYGQRREPTKALEYYQRAMTLFETAGDRTWSARSQNNIGQMLRNQGKYGEALAALQKSSATFEELGDKLPLANSMLDISHIYELQGNYPASLEYRQKALALGETLGNKGIMALALNQSGWANFLQGNPVQALEYFRKSLALRESLGNKQDIAETLNQMSLAYRLQGDFVRAEDSGLRALAVSEPLGNKGLTANILMTLGLVYGALGNLTQSLEFYQKSLAAAEEARAKPLIANALEKIGGVYSQQGHIEAALEHIQKSLKLNEELGNKRQIIFSANAIGAIHSSQGNYAQALEYHRRGLKLSEEIGNKVQIAYGLGWVGGVRADQGDYTQALEDFQQSLKLGEETGQVPVVQGSLNNIGGIYRLRGDLAQAMTYDKRSLALAEKMGSKVGIRIALANIGETYRLQGNYGQAIEHLQKSLAMSEEMEARLSIPGTLISMAAVHLSQADYTQSFELATRAAEIARQTGQREYLRSALTTLGRSYRALNQPDKARHSFEEAIALGESLRSTVAGQESRATYFATVQRPYELYIDLLMQLHKQHPADSHDAFALQVNERARARSLLEALGEARADIRQGIDPVLLQRERTLQQRLNATAERQTRLLTGKHTDDQLASVKKEIAALTAEFKDAQAQIRQRSPRYAALTQPIPLSPPEIQQLLDPETLLLEYALGDERSYLWAVSPNSITSFELPKRAEIEVSVRRVVELLSNGERWATTPEINSEYAAAAARLSSTLLPPALMSQMKAKRLVIVGDGALQYLPFGALPSPDVKRPTSEKQQPTANALPLIADFEIVSLPSASTLGVLRKETANRTRGLRSVAVLADPVFDETDQRVAAAITRQNQNGTAAPGSSLRDSGSLAGTDSRVLLERAFRVETTSTAEGAKRDILRITRLPFTRFEAEGILAAAPANQNLKATDFRANRETATSPELSQYRYVHFATHGILNSEHPELSGVVLSLVNEKGEAVDGFLRLHEIYNLNLPADLVVLSACQTGLGKEIRGEGLIGLTRGFMYAGAPRVVASLWKVDDAATAELMKRFYRGMLKDNLPPAAALRQAKVEMWKQKRWNAPFYWAAFELQGEWK